MYYDTEKKQTIQDRKLYHVKFIYDTENHGVESVTIGAYSEEEAYQKALKIFGAKGYELELMAASLRYNGPWSHRVFI